MNLSNHYWYFKSALTPRFCDQVIAYANAQKESMARTGGYGDGELKKDTYEAEDDLLLDFNQREFLQEHPDIDINILKNILENKKILRRRIDIVKKMNPQMASKKVLETAIYEIAKRRSDYIDRKNKLNKQSRQERLFPEGEEPKKEPPQFTDFSNTVPEPEGGWLSWSKTISNLFSGKDEL